MTYLNHYEAEDAYRIFDAERNRLPNLHLAAHIILALIEWTDSCSDGWTYWRKPRQAAAGLVTLIEYARREHLRGHEVRDISFADLRSALRPIKAFLTRAGVDHGADLPWAAILPVNVKEISA